MQSKPGLEQATVKEIVDKAVTHKWGVPEFQRGFVWSPQKVRDLVDSLWRGYPVGSFLVWYAGDYAQPRTMEDHQVPDAWVVDASSGQQPWRSSWAPRSGPCHQPPCRASPGPRPSPRCCERLAWVVMLWVEGTGWCDPSGSRRS